MKLRSLFLSILVIGLIINCVPLFASNQTSTPHQELELQSIDQEIEKIDEQLASYRRAALNEETDSQPDMIDHWEAFIKHVSNAEEKEKQILELKEKKKKLIERKHSVLSDG